MLLFIQNSFMKLLSGIFLSLVMGTVYSCTTPKIKEDIHADYSVKLQEEFTITLNSNPSTGYSWEWVNKKAINIVGCVDFKFISPNNGMVGAGGTEKWTFKATKTGTDTLVFVYRRPWEQKLTDETKKIIVSVH